MRYGKLVFCGMLVCSIFGSLPTFATTYSHDVNVRFTFNSEINVVIDTADIEILDLAPGTSSDSNVVGITISTNNVVGYTASATVGNATYNTTSMTHTNGTDAFASLATDDSLSSLTTDNTWGYTTSLDNGSSWANLSGLPIYTDTAKEIAKTTSPASDAIKFKINAKAATTQASGDYKNVINFTVVANVPPKTLDDVLESDPDTPADPETHLPIIQAVTEDICEQVEAIDEQSILTDIRDHKNYFVAKLKDNNCWMTQNLDLDLDSTKTYTNADTDLGWNGTSYSAASWQPLNSTIPSSNIDATTGLIAGWQSNSSEPYSVDGGELYWDANNLTFDETPNTSGKHTHIGNYYNFIAAVAKNEGVSGYGAQPNSICPKNWGLPPIDQNGYSMNNLYRYYGNTTATGEYFYSAPLYFVGAGQVSAIYDSGTDAIYGTRAGYGEQGFYWYSVKNALQIYPNSITMFASDAYIGHSVRCRVRNTARIAINFDANNGTGSMPSQEVKINKSVKLAANQFTRDGYKFVGWNTNADGLGIGYGNEDEYTANVSGSTTSVTLYAQWEADPSGQGGSSYQGRTLARAFEEAYLYNNGNYEGHRGMYVPERDASGNYTGNYYEATSQSDYEGIPARDLRFAMQDADLEVDGQKVCNRANVAGSEVHLLDLRDNKSYWAVVTKNGKCWMTQNLDLNLSVNKTLTPADTDVTSNWTPPQNTISYTSGTISGWPDDSLGDYGGPAMSVDVGNWYFAGFNYNDRCTNGCDYINGTTDGVFSQTPYKLNGEHGHVGNYYNWHAAHATSDPYIQTDTPSETSICPKGWFLPYFRGSSNPEDGDDLVQLMYTYSSTDMNSDVNLVPGPFYLVHAGRITVGRLAEAGINFQFWAREYGNHYWGYSGYGYMTSNSGIDYIASIQRKSAVTIRCLMR